MSANNMTNAVRELWVPGVVEQVFLQTPLLTMLKAGNKITVRGGNSITQAVDMAEIDDLAQDYGANEQLNSGKFEFLDRPTFKWKKFQIPIEYDEEEESEGGGGNDVAPVDLVKTKVEKGLRAAKLHLNRAIYSSASTTSDSDKGFQGILDALTFDYTYGTLTRATTVTNKWWQSFSYAASFADGGTARDASIDNFRTVLAGCQRYSSGKASDFVFVCPGAIFRKLQAQVEASGTNSHMGEGPLGKYGWTTIQIDGVEILHDPFLDTNTDTTTTAWVFMLHKPSWELRLFPGRDLSRVSPFKYQGETANGYDKYLARVLVKGNFVCWQPNANYYGTNWS
jgi:hypothetical protein